MTTTSVYHKEERRNAQNRATGVEHLKTERQKEEEERWTRGGLLLLVMRGGERCDDVRGRLSVCDVWCREAGGYVRAAHDGDVS